MFFLVIGLVILGLLGLAFIPNKEAQEEFEEKRKLEEMRSKPDEIVEVSLAQLMARPSLYKYDYTFNKKIVKLTDKMVVGYNNAQSKKFTLYRSTGEGRQNYATSPYIEVDYSGLVFSLEKLVMLNNKEKIIVEGKVQMNSYGFTIKATNLKWWNWV